MDRNQSHPLEKLNSIVDLGVHFDSNLTFRDHISEKINKAYSVLGIIKRNFIYKATVRPHVEFANFVWCPYKLGDIKEIEKNPKEGYKTLN